MAWLAKRAAVLSTVWSDGAIPTARTKPDYTLPSNYSGVSWLAWDISARDYYFTNLIFIAALLYWVCDIGVPP